MPAKQKKRKALIGSSPGATGRKRTRATNPSEAQPKSTVWEVPHSMFPPNAADRHSTNNEHAGFWTLRAGSIKTLA